MEDVRRPEVGIRGAFGSQSVPVRKVQFLRLQSPKRQAIEIQRNIEAPSRNHFCRGKAMCITYSHCASAALGIQHAMRMGRIVICGLSDSTIFFHISHTRHSFGKKKY